MVKYLLSKKWKWIQNWCHHEQKGIDIRVTSASWTLSFLRKIFLLKYLSLYMFAEHDYWAAIISLPYQCNEMMTKVGRDVSDHLVHFFIWLIWNPGQEWRKLAKTYSFWPAKPGVGLWLLVPWGHPLAIRHRFSFINCSYNKCALQI